MENKLFFGLAFFDYAEESVIAKRGEKYWTLLAKVSGSLRRLGSTIEQHYAMSIYSEKAYEDFKKRYINHRIFRSIKHE